MKPDVIGVLWPSPENYPRFAAVSEDELDATFEEFVTRVGAKLARFAQENRVEIEPLGFDPDELAAWCRSNGRKVDTQGRSAYAAFLLTKGEAGRE